MHRPAHLDHIKPGGACKPVKFRRRAEHGGVPSRITEPATNAAVRGPQTPPPQFADDKPAAGLQHASHFYDGPVGIANEAKHSHRNDTVENCIVEWQPLGLSLNEMQPSTLGFGASSRGG